MPSRPSDRLVDVVVLHQSPLDAGPAKPVSAGAGAKRQPVVPPALNRAQTLEKLALPHFACLWPRLWLPARSSSASWSRGCEDNDALDGSMVHSRRHLLALCPGARRGAALRRLPRPRRLATTAPPDLNVSTLRLVSSQRWCRTRRSRSFVRA